MPRPIMSRFHEKLINSMVHDIFNSVNNKCKGNLVDTQKTLSFLLFGEDHVDECDHVIHPNVLRELIIKKKIHPNKFIEIFNHVHTF